MKNKLNKDTQNILNIVSAEKSSWFGGIKGVRGENFKIVLSVNSGKEFVFEELIFTDGEKLMIQQKREKDTYLLLSHWTAERVEATQSLDSEKIQQKSKVQEIGNNAKVIYHVNGSKEMKSIDVEFKNKPTSNENFYP